MIERFYLVKWEARDGESEYPVFTTVNASRKPSFKRVLEEYYGDPAKKYEGDTYEVGNNYQLHTLYSIQNISPKDNETLRTLGVCWTIKL